MPISPPAQRELQILEHIETNPDATQADLAEELGAASGTVNFAIRRLISRGYIRAKQLQRRRLKYIITPPSRCAANWPRIPFTIPWAYTAKSAGKALILEARQKGYGPDRQADLPGARYAHKNRRRQGPPHRDLRHHA